MPQRKAKKQAEGQDAESVPTHVERKVRFPKVLDDALKGIADNELTSFSAVVRSFCLQGVRRAGGLKSAS